MIGFSMTLITMIAALAGPLAGIEGVYPIFVGGITGLAGLYITGNVSTKWVNGKTGSTPTEEPKPDAPEESK